MSVEVHLKASKLLISNSLYFELIVREFKTPILTFSNSLSVDLKLQFQNKNFEFEKIIILKSPITSLQKCQIHLRFQILKQRNF